MIRWMYWRGGFKETDVLAQRSFFAVAIGRRFRFVASWYPLEVRL